jgi:CubicO group peptidase (beta-lactamase class C family)
MAEHPGTSAPARAFFEKVDRQGTSLRAYGESRSGDVVFSQGDPSLPLALTGITQVFLLAMVLRDIDRGAISRDTLISDVLPSTYAHGLCVVKGSDYTESITVGQLLAGSSGIPDFFDPPARGIRPLRAQLEETDRSWSLPEALELARHYPGVFVPGTRKGHHSSTNQILMGELLHETTGMGLPALLELRVTKALGLNSTYFFSQEHHSTFFTLAPIHHKETIVHIPRALSSLGAAGGIVSTPRETVRFLHALRTGAVFNSDWWDAIQADPTSFGFSPGGRAKSLVTISGISGVSAGFDTRSHHAAVVATNQWGGADSASTYLRTALGLV